MDHLEALHGTLYWSTVPHLRTHALENSTINLAIPWVDFRNIILHLGLPGSFLKVTKFPPNQEAKINKCLIPNTNLGKYDVQNGQY